MAAMDVLIAPGRFGPLSPVETTSVLVAAWQDAAPHVDVLGAPQADGGPGTAEVLAGDTAQLAPIEVNQRPVPVLHQRDTGTAYLDAAAADLPDDPTSAPLGAVLRALIEQGSESIVIGLGGTRWLDGGRGFVTGLTGLDPVAGLADTQAVLGRIKVTALADVNRTLLGFQGACYSAVEERGISKAAAQDAEQSMGRWTDDLRRTIPPRRDLLQDKEIRPERRPGSGAGGGLGYLLLAAGASLVPGPAFVARHSDLTGLVDRTRLAVTATEVFDWRVLDHSVPAEVTAAAAASATPVVALADEVHVGRREQMSLGLQGAYSINRSGWSRSEPADAAELADELRTLARRVAGTWTPPPRRDVH